MIGFKRVSEYRSIRKARSEAQFVVTQLNLAIAWCRHQQVPKTPLKNCLQLSKSKRLSHRTKHLETPPSLFELTFPLPSPPGERDYHEVIERAPRWFSNPHDSNQDPTTTTTTTPPPPSAFHPTSLQQQQQSAATRLPMEDAYDDDVDGRFVTMGLLPIYSPEIDKTVGEIRLDYTPIVER